MWRQTRIVKRKPFIYQDQLLKAQDEAKRKKLGIWSVSALP
ncbi:thermonuclease family protein [Candidatus Amesbacteria bacterium]|nr:thermonuclease family protein [Candidatus Amesbacteria bacterium]